MREEGRQSQVKTTLFKPKKNSSLASFHSIREIKSEEGGSRGKIHAHKCDVSRADEVEEMFKWIQKEKGEQKKNISKKIVEHQFLKI